VSDLESSQSSSSSSLQQKINSLSDQVADLTTKLKSSTMQVRTLQEQNSVKEMSLKSAK